MQRPAGITIIAGLFFVAAAYLGTVSAVQLILHGPISTSRGAQLMYGLEMAGPRTALLVGAEWVLIGWGLWLRHPWARWAAAVVMVIGIVMLVPKIGSAEIGLPLLWAGLQIAARAAAAWYLAQAPAVVDAFGK